MIEKDRNFQRISLSNTELYFNVLIQEYFETIEKANEDTINNIALVLRELYDLFIQYIELIKQNQIFSQNDIKIIQILFYAPIIATDNFNINRLKSNINNKDNKEYDNYTSENIIVMNNRASYC